VSLIRPSENRVSRYGAKQAAIGRSESVRFGLKSETIPHAHRAVLSQRGLERGHVGRNRALIGHLRMGLHGAKSAAIIHICNNVRHK
jgi:hypothetical protein